MRANSNCNSSSASLQVDIRITDGKTGEERYAKQVTKTEQGQTVCGGRAQVDVSGLMRAAAQSVSMGLVTIMYPVKVVDVDADGQVLLNYGEGLLAAGDFFALFQQGREIRDPDTGAILGNSEKYLGLVKITDDHPIALGKGARPCRYRGARRYRPRLGTDAHDQHRPHHDPSRL
jgi:hypothetical protein